MKSVKVQYQNHYFIAHVWLDGRILVERADPGHPNTIDPNPDPEILEEIERALPYLTERPE